MITVAGFNSSVDKFVELDELRTGAALRARSVKAFPGGKGLHVALTIAELGEPVTLVGPCDPGTFPMFNAFLTARGVRFAAVKIPEPIRTCLSIREDSGVITELREPGPTIDADVIGELCEAVKNSARDGAYTIMSGSVPPGAPDTLYRDLCRTLADAGKQCLVDGSGSLLRNALDGDPLLIKPNQAEAAELAGSGSGAMEIGRQLAERGPPMVAMSLGDEGMLAYVRGRCAELSPPKREVVNTVGSGDCLLGGLAVGLARELPIEETLKLGIACGTANVLNNEIGVIRRSDVETLVPEVKFRWVDAAEVRS